MSLKITPFALTFILFLQNPGSCHLLAQTKSAYSKEVQHTIREVESNLAPWAIDQDSLRFTIQERMAKYNIQGLSIAVIRNYKIEWAKGYGWADVSEKRPVTSKTLFQAGSVSKSLNGIGVLKLAQDKKLDLEADINNYLVTWKFPYDTLSKNKKITTANLLSHTAGLTGHGFQGYANGNQIPSISDILDGRKPANSEAVRSIGEPGKTVEYSGGGITISQLIVTDITHKPYEEYMQEKVLKPMGMKESFFTQPAPQSKKYLLASGYQPDGKELTGVKYNIYPEKAAAGLWTNPTDLGKYIIETQRSLSGKSSKVLSQDMTRLRLTPSPLDNESGYGVFIEKKGKERYFTHSGGTNGFISEYIGSFENGNGVIIMTNSANPGICQEIINSVAIVYKWPGFYNPSIRKTIALPDTILDKYVGEYVLNGQTVTVVKKENGLWLNSAIQSKMHFTSGIDFYTTESKVDYTFTTDANGVINGFTDTKNRTAKRIR